MDKKEKKHQRNYRLWFQAAWTAITNGYAAGFLKGRIFTGTSKAICVPGLNCYSCPGALGACPIGALQAVLGSRGFKVSSYVFGILMVFGAVFGRFICGWMCPFGLVQDLLYKIPIFRKQKNMPKDALLRKLKYIILLLFVILLPSLAVNVVGQGDPWFCKYICPSGTLLAGIPLISTNPLLRSAVGFLFSWKMLALLIILFLSVKYYRPFCKYLCPLGAVYGAFHPIAFYRLKIDEGKCVGCGACVRTCPMGVDVINHPNSMECIRCGECMKACPTNAIQSTMSEIRKKSPESVSK